MSYTMEDFKREMTLKYFEKLSPEDQKKFLRSVPPEERLAGMPPEERLAGMPPEERLAGLSPEEIQQYLDQLTLGRNPRVRKPRKKK